MYISGADASVVESDSSIFESNVATGSSGGAIFASNIPSFVIDAGTAFASNEARTDGGAAFFSNVSSITLRGIAATSNTCVLNTWWTVFPRLVV